MSISGPALKSILNRNKISIAELCLKISKSRSYLYTQMQSEQVAMSLLAEITTLYGIDFKNYLPEEGLKQYQTQLLYKGPQTEGADLYKEKYWELLEAHAQLLQKYLTLLEAKL
jgi:hypothetical protein